MIPDIRLVAIDLDGTLLDSRKRLDPDFPAVLAALLARGIAVVPASGRQHESIRRVVLGEASTPGGAAAGTGLGDVAAPGELDIIAENGALVTRGERVVAVDAVPRDAVGRVLDAVASYRAGGADVGVVLCGRRSAWVTRRDEAFLAVTAPYYPLLRTVDDLRDVEDDVLKLALWEPAGAEAGVLPAVAGIEGVRTIASARVWADVMSPTADKGRALEALQRELGVTPEQTMAFGDFPNDVGMLGRAAWSYAMAGAHPEAVAAARYRAPSNDAQGVTTTLRSVLGL